jgi:cardiolipin synthase A/B
MSMRRSDQGEEIARYFPYPAVCSYPVREGNLISPLVGGEASFRRICEAVESAKYSVWLTVAFIWPVFKMPDGRGSLFDVLDGAIARGLDVRVIFWRPNPESMGYGYTFGGAATDREMLEGRASRFRIRWDRAHGPCCNHQKSWLIDAGRTSETAFVGGINLNPNAYRSEEGTKFGQHDMYVEITGPSASDVHHNFVQRWNEASERHLDGGTWAHSADEALRFPKKPSPGSGRSLAQIQRTIHAGRYSNGHAAAHGQSYNIADGERSIFEQYRMAINAAQRSIYIENQAIPVRELAVELEGALKRGVEITMLVPGDPDDGVRASRRNPEYKPQFDQIAALDRYETFVLAGIAVLGADGHRSNVYVHGKVMLIDDVWATIGSCNLHAFSLFRNAEMNVSFWDPTAVRSLRCALFAEHLGQETARLDDRAALNLYRNLAQENRLRRDAGNSDWQGSAFKLDAATYAA